MGARPPTREESDAAFAPSNIRALVDLAQSCPEDYRARLTEYAKQGLRVDVERIVNADLRILRDRKRGERHREKLLTQLARARAKEAARAAPTRRRRSDSPLLFE